MPPITRPGARLVSVAISIAVIAAVRATAGRMPSPTRRCCVLAKATAASGGAVVKKQSSMSHNSCSPAASARRA
jgi:hypothetical protein